MKRYTFGDAVISMGGFIIFVLASLIALIIMQGLEFGEYHSLVGAGAWILFYVSAMYSYVCRVNKDESNKGDKQCH